jgi:cytochrome c553
MLVVSTACSTSLFAAPDDWAPCAACHGARAEGNPALDGPALAGQYAWYTARELRQFSDGLRGSHPGDPTGRQMQPFAAGLDPTQRQSIAEYLAELEPASKKGSMDGDLMNGSRYYQARCGSCHGGRAEGNEAFQAPSLQGLSPEYLERQMRYFREGIRGSDDDDRYGRQMGMMAGSISERELEDVLHFITEQY